MQMENGKMCGPLYVGSKKLCDRVMQSTLCVLEVLYTNYQMNSPFSL